MQTEWQRTLPTTKQVLQRSLIAQFGSTGKVHRQITLKTAQEADQVTRLKKKKKLEKNNILPTFLKISEFIKILGYWRLEKSKVCPQCGNLPLPGWRLTMAKLKGTVCPLQQVLHLHGRGTLTWPTGAHRCQHISLQKAAKAIGLTAWCRF